MDRAKFCETAWAKVDMDWVITCDKTMCDKCATRIAADIDFCPDCLRKIKIKGGIKK